MSTSFDNIEISAVLTQPDRRSGRGRTLQSNPIKQWAVESSVPVRDPQKPGIEEVTWLNELGVDLILVMAYGHILKQALLDAAPLGCFNLHASLLPKYRGASPIETSIAMGEETTGVTLMQVISQMDAGPIIDSESIYITSDDTGISARGKIAKACIPLINRSLPTLISKNFQKVEQVEKDATYCRKLNKADGRMDFSLSADDLVCRNRAFEGWPGSYFLDGDTILRVGKMEKDLRDLNLKPGQRYEEVVDSLIVGTGSGAISISELQKPGGKMLPVSDFLRGYSLPSKISFSLPSESRALVS
jgi:methionyl-tRNA formyltransferase